MISDTNDGAYALAHREYTMQTTAGNKLVGNSDKWNLSPLYKNFSIERSKNDEQIRISATYTNADIFLVPKSQFWGYTGKAGNINGTYYHWRGGSFDISQSVALEVMSMKAGMNSSPTFHDYLIYDHNTCRKETTTFNMNLDNDNWYVASTHSPLSNISPGLGVSPAGMSLLMKNAMKYYLDAPINNDPNSNNPPYESYRVVTANSSSKTIKQPSGWTPKTNPTLLSNNSKTLEVSQSRSFPFFRQDQMLKIV
jgi:hypothetical protein